MTAELLGGDAWLNESHRVLSFRPENVLSHHTCRSRCRQVIKGNLIRFLPDQSTVCIGKTEKCLENRRLNGRRPLGTITTDVLKIHEPFTINKCPLVHPLHKELRQASLHVTVLSSLEQLAKTGSLSKIRYRICVVRLMFSLWIHRRAQAPYKLMYLNKESFIYVMFSQDIRIPTQLQSGEIPSWWFTDSILLSANLFNEQ